MGGVRPPLFVGQKKEKKKKKENKKEERDIRRGEGGTTQKRIHTVVFFIKKAINNRRRPTLYNVSLWTTIHKYLRQFIHSDWSDDITPVRSVETIGRDTRAYKSFFIPIG